MLEYGADHLGQYFRAGVAEEDAQVHDPGDVDEKVIVDQLPELAGADELVRCLPRRRQSDKDQEHLAPHAGDVLVDAGVARCGVQVVLAGQELQDADEVRLEGGIVDKLRPRDEDFLSKHNLEPSPLGLLHVCLLRCMCIRPLSPDI